MKPSHARKDSMNVNFKRNYGSTESKVSPEENGTSGFDRKIKEATK